MDRHARRLASLSFILLATLAGCEQQATPPPMLGMQPGQTGFPTTGVPIAGMPMSGLPTSGFPMTGFPMTGYPMTGVHGTVPSLAGQPPCIVGSWQANDFLQMVRRNLRASLRGEAQLTAAGGTIRFEFQPLDATGRGELVTIADDLVHRAQARESGITVTATHTMRGQAKMPYRLPSPGGLVVEEPTESDLRANISVRATGGFRLGGGGRPRFDLSDEYLYECSPTELRVWEAGPEGRRGNPVVFDRVVTP
jgi:hypothetical protein